MPRSSNAIGTPPARSGATLAKALEGQLPADECRQIATIPERYVEHAHADDWAAVANLYHPEALRLMPDVPPAEGREAIRAAMARLLGSAGGVRLAEFDVAIAEAELLDETVYVRAEYRLIRKPLGAPGDSFSLAGPYVNHLRRDPHGTWRIWRQFVGRAHPIAGPALS